MAGTITIRETFTAPPESRIAIIASKWHADCVENLITGCLEELLRHNTEAPEVHRLPGCFELPLAARRLFQRDSSLEVVIALGVIVKGDTDHYQMIRDECLRGFSRVMFEFDRPIVMEVLAVHNLDDAKKRSGFGGINKGQEAALTALEIIEWRRLLKLP